MLVSCTPCNSALEPRLVGDPIDTLTGAVFDRRLEFRLTGPLELRWYRHYDSSQHHRRFALGYGRTHELDRILRLGSDGISCEIPVGRVLQFPPLSNDGDEWALNGFVIRRLSQRQYRLFRHGEPAMEFEFKRSDDTARLKQLFRGSHRITFDYGPTRRLERIVDSIGRKVSVDEAVDGRLMSLTLERRQEKPQLTLAAYKYDTFGNLIAISDRSGHTCTFEYDEANRMILQVGRKGFKFRFDYDKKGRCSRSTGDEGMYAVAIDYKVPGRLTKVTKSDGGVWTYCFDCKAGLTQILDPLGGVQKFLRDETGKVAVELDQNQNPIRILYDKSGEPIAKVNPFGRRIRIPDDPNIADPLEHRVPSSPVEYEYGNLFNWRRIRLPQRADVTFLPLSSNAKRFVVVSDEQSGIPIGEEKFKVGPIGTLWWPRPKLGRIFDELGTLMQQQDEFGRLRAWSYDASENVSEYVDFDGSKWSYEHGSWHLTRGLKNPLGAEVSFSYTASGNVASCTDAGGTRSEYRYDFNDHRVEVKRHGSVRETYERDAFGNLLSKRGGDGRILLTFEIGPGNLPTKRTLASGDEHVFQYDKSGRHLVAATKKDFVEFAYDSFGNRVLDHRNGKGVRLKFEGWRKPTEWVYFGRFPVNYARHTDDLFVICDPGGKSHRIRFYTGGIVERIFSNGTHETAQYDSLKRCLFKSVDRVAGPIWNRSYRWSGEGELRAIEDNTFGQVRHEYDAAHRLCRRFVGGFVEDYVMDHADNLISQPGLSEVTLQHGNRLRAANGFHFEYNDRNHIRVRESSSGQVRYSYDSRDQLVRVDTPSGTWEAEYDALGRRTRKTWAGHTTEYYWHGDQLASEVRSGGQLRIYMYADPLAVTPLLFLDYDSLASKPDSCRRYFVLADQIGTPCSVEDEHGTEVWSAHVEPFGRAHVRLGAKIEFNFRFPGHYFDAELGLHYNRFRNYDPCLGRYLQSDPWGIAGGFNIYAYCSNPLLKVDVRGLGAGNEKDDPAKQDEEGTSPGVPPGGEDEGWTPKPRQEPEDPPRYGDVLADMSDGARQRDADYGVQIFSDEERENYRVVSNDDGQLVWNANGEPVDTGDHPAIYVMDQDGNVYMHPDPEFGAIHHSSLANGQPVAGAGEMQVINGQPTQIDDRSGHYGGNLPDGAPDRTKNELNSQGVNTNNTNTEEVQS